MAGNKNPILTLKPDKKKELPLLGPKDKCFYNPTVNEVKGTAVIFFFHLHGIRRKCRKITVVRTE